MPVVLIVVQVCRPQRIALSSIRSWSCPIFTRVSFCLITVCAFSLTHRKDLMRWACFCPYSRVSICSGLGFWNLAFWIVFRLSIFSMSKMLSDCTLICYLPQAKAKTSCSTHYWSSYWSFLWGFLSRWTYFLLFGFSKGLQRDFVYITSQIPLWWISSFSSKSIVSVSWQNLCCILSYAPGQIFPSHCGKIESAPPCPLYNPLSSSWLFSSSSVTQRASRTQTLSWSCSCQCKLVREFLGLDKNVFWVWDSGRSPRLVVCVDLSCYRINLSWCFGWLVSGWCWKICWCWLVWLVLGCKFRSCL